jgi:RNA polymerase sigma-70 factor (ECF subfamily)
MQDAELHAAALAGGPEAFAPIVRRYQDAVFGVALARLGDFHEAEDVAQGVFLTAFQQLGNLRDPSRLGAWLRSITIHRSIDRIRRRKEMYGPEQLDRHPDPQAGPDATAQRGELREAALAAIARLSRAQRETTTLFYINGYSVAEVAAMQEAPVGTVKRRLHDARERLKQEMIHMVESALKSESPKEDFAGRVFELLSRAIPREGQPKISWHEVVAELRRIGTEGIEGFARALESPHHKTRRMAASQLTLAQGAETTETVVELLKRALRDPNRKVRRMAGPALLYLDVPYDRKRREFLPLVLPMLHDPSRRVRRNLPYHLQPFAADMPLETVARAFAEETDPLARRWLRVLMRKVVAAEKAEDNNG